MLNWRAKNEFKYAGQHEEHVFPIPLRVFLLNRLRLHVKHLLLLLLDHKSSSFFSPFSVLLLLQLLKPLLPRELHDQHLQ